MRIGIVTPAPPRSQTGNRVTALRWARLLRELGHRVAVVQRFQSQAFDLLIALHARRSADAVIRFRDLHPLRPIVLVLTGTDLYRDIRTSRAAQQALALADRLVVAHSLGCRAVPVASRARVRLVPKSAAIPASLKAKRRRDGKARFRVCVLGHLRPVKDPFRTPLAVRRLPQSSRIEVHHFGAALSAAAARRARREMRRNPRYRWYGEVPRTTALRHLAESKLLVISSRMEGAANAVAEAVALQVPILASRIDGCVGMLGPDYAGYFSVGATASLADLLHRAETDPRFYARLSRQCRRLRGRVSPDREKAALAQLIGELQSAPARRVTSACSGARRPPDPAPPEGRRRPGSRCGPRRCGAAARVRFHSRPG